MGGTSKSAVGGGRSSRGFTAKSELISYVILNRNCFDWKLAPVPDLA